MKNKTIVQRQSTSNNDVFRFIVYVTVVILYCSSSLALIIGAGVLVFILIYGSLYIDDGRWLAIGIITFLPLRYLKKYLEGKGFSKLTNRKEK